MESLYPVASLTFDLGNRYKDNMCESSSGTTLYLTTGRLNHLLYNELCHYILFAMLKILDTSHEIQPKIYIVTSTI